MTDDWKFTPASDMSDEQLLAEATQLMEYGAASLAQGDEARAALFARASYCVALYTDYRRGELLYSRKPNPN